MFLAITSVGWGFNWPVTKYLIERTAAADLRGTTGVIGASLLAVLALLPGQSLQVPPEFWPRLVLAAFLNVMLDGADGIGAALASGQRSRADRLHHAGMGLAAGLARARRAAESVARHFAGDGVRGTCGDHGRQWPGGERGEAAGDHHGARRRRRLCGRHGDGEEVAAQSAAADGRRLADRNRLPAGRADRLCWSRRPTSHGLSGIGWILFFYSTVDPVLHRLCRWFAALARLPASVAAIGTMAVPVIGVVASAVALHEPLGIGQIAALALTLAGVVLATRS